MSSRPFDVNGIALDSEPSYAPLCRAMRSLAAVLLAFASSAYAQGLDRDTLLTDAPAVPAVGTVRMAGAGVAAEKSDRSSSSLTGSIGCHAIDQLTSAVGA